MDKLGTWLAVTGVAIGFVVLAWLLFSDNPKDKKTKALASGCSVMRSLSLLAILLWLPLVSACKTSSDPGVAGIYQTWDDVISRWIGKHKEDLYLELGPPNLHPKEAKTAPSKWWRT